MSTATLNLRWANAASNLRAVPVTFVRQLASPQPHLRCPECNSILYSRRHHLCGVCGAPLPKSFLFSAAEAQRVERLLQVDREKHRAWMQRAQQ